MVKSPKLIIFDSSGLISLVKTDDFLHEKAVSVAKILITDGWNILLPYEILAESLNTIGKLISMESSIKVGDAILDQYATKELTFIQSEPHIVSSALLIAKTATGTPSYIDCLVMAFADEYRTQYVFGFDATFKKNGYYLPNSIN